MLAESDGHSDKARSKYGELVILGWVLSFLVKLDKSLKFQGAFIEAFDTFQFKIDNIFYFKFTINLIAKLSQQI